YALIFGPSEAWGQEHKNLFSPTAAQLIHDTAYDLTRLVLEEPETDDTKIGQSLILLKAAISLDAKDPYIFEDIINSVSLYQQKNHTALVREILAKYTGESVNLEVTMAAVRYLLKQENSREEREQLLGSLSITELGLLRAETADPCAIDYFRVAYEKNKYNNLAFQKIIEHFSGKIHPGLYLEHLRLRLSVNPYDLQVALAFAEYAERLQLYDDAAVDAYRYCGELFEHLYPGEPLGPEIYIPLSISAYNSKRLGHICLQMATKVRQSGRFDLVVESLAAKTSSRTNPGALSELERKAVELVLAGDKTEQKVTSEQMAWFYSFVMPDPIKAIEWANSSYARDPNPTAGSLLAYALMMNDQADGSAILIDEQDLNQISQFTLAMIQLNQDKKAEAIENIKAAIDRDPGSLAAETAKEILEKNQSEYLPPVDSEIALALLKNNFAGAIVPAFVKPEKIIKTELNLRGGTFSYGGRFGATIAVTNNSSDPLIISDDSLFTGRIRVDAEVTGDMELLIHDLVRTRYRPAGPVEPGDTILIPVRLNTGLLRQTLLKHPQASLKIKFTAYLDPVIDQGGRVSNRYSFIEPLTASAERTGIKITHQFLQNKFNSIARKGSAKGKTARLFLGLLHEQAVMAGREPLYKFVYADWMPEMLKSAIVNVLAGDDWVSKAGTLAAMTDLPLDYKLINAVSDNLNDPYWPVRMMAVYVLANNPNANFDKVLQWVVEKDTNPLVRELAASLIEK
ncbi:MAG: hypothetical protein ACYTBV_06085, partial [Planctomycetota bacterium]